MKMNN